MGFFKALKEGIFKNNPTFVQLLGMCSTLAVTTNVKDAIGMGLSATVVLTCSNAVISLVRKLIPSKIRIASYVVIIAGFVTVIDLLLQAYLPDLSASLGIFIPLIVVNCIILARAESFASKNTILPSIGDGLGIGLGFTLALLILGAIREILGSGSILGIPILPESVPAVMMILPPGGFIVLGLLIGLIHYIGEKRKEKKANV